MIPNTILDLEREARNSFVGWNKSASVGPWICWSWVT